MWKGVLITLGIIVGLIIIIKLSTRNSNNNYGSGGDLRSSLSSIRGRFDDVCKKIGLRSGC